MKLQIIVDNYSKQQNLSTDWGLSCLLDNTLLFDTGWHEEIFWKNWETLGNCINDVNLLVLSHEHYDHVGSLNSILEKNPKIKVFLCKSSPNEFFENLRSRNISYIKTSDRFDKSANCIMQNPRGTIWLTEEFIFNYKGKVMAEQALVIKTEKGYSLLCGCSHPGIVLMINWVKRHFGIEEFYLVAGGFHLKDTAEDEIKEVVQQFKEANIKYIAPSHCTGETAQSIFKQEFKERFLPLGAGNILEL